MTVETGDILPEEAEVALRRRYALDVLGEPIRAEWLEHADGCGWKSGSECRCLYAVMFVSDTKILGVGWDFSTCLRRLH